MKETLYRMGHSPAVLPAAWGRAAAALGLLAGWLLLARGLAGSESLYTRLGEAGAGGLVLLWNLVCLLLSLRYGWRELRLAAFAGTWLLFLLYYLQLHLPGPEGWSTPLRAAWSIYLFYTAALFCTSWMQRREQGGLNLRLGIVNGFLFGFWVLVLGKGGLPVTYVMLAMGGIYLLLSLGTYRMTQELSTPVMTKLFGGLFLLLLAAIRFARDLQLPPQLFLICGIALSMGLLAAGQLRRLDLLRGGAILVWLAVLLRWLWLQLHTAADLPAAAHGQPFLQGPWGIWLLLLLSGGLLCRRSAFGGLQEEDNRIVNGTLILLTQVCFGGLAASLLPWNEAGFLPRELALSAIWGGHALGLFLWGTWKQRKRYQAFGSFALICIFVKALMYDLGSAGLREKLMVLAVLALVSCTAAAVNNRCSRRAESGLPAGETVRKQGEVGRSA
ncbi:hypothetical protein J2T17_003026 [Paenibacillus mucilaginosus]|uniref:hypothetical protein n=1 Tax=Paenibacillus mucilaginosus TaxID=61624 RepID=UPI003D20B1D7